MRRLLFLVGGIVFVDTMFFTALTPLLPDYAKTYDLSKAGAMLGYVDVNSRFYISASAGCFASNPVHGVINLTVVCKK